METNLPQHRKSYHNLPLTNYQIKGVEDYGLSIKQVLSINFGAHTLTGMRILLESNRAENHEAAFLVLKDLNESQVDGIIALKLNRAEVESRNFGHHTIHAIETLITGLICRDKHEAFDTVAGLYPSQIEKMLRTPNFGRHTVIGMKHLQEQNQNLSKVRVFEMVKELNHTQIKGIIFHGLSRYQVTTTGFGEDIMNGIDELMRNNSSLTDQMAFEIIKELDSNQITGVVDYNLTRSQVQKSSFGKHTLEGMEFLFDKNFNVTDAPIYKMVSDLEAHQIRGMIDFKLDRSLVIDTSFSEKVLKTIQLLKVNNPKAKNEHLYNTALYMPEYQSRALVNHNLTLEQIGITVDTKGYFKSIQASHEKFSAVLSGVQVDALEFLVTQKSMSEDAAIDIALQLNSKQVVAMITFGLDLKQVQTPCFKNNLTVLEQIANSLDKEGFDAAFKLSASEIFVESDFVLPEDAKQKACKIFDTLVANDTQKKQETTLEGLTIPIQSRGSDPEKGNKNEQETSSKILKRSKTDKKPESTSKRPRI